MIDLQDVGALVQRLQCGGVTLFEFEGAQGLLRLHFATPLPDTGRATHLGTVPTQQPVAAQAMLRSLGIGYLRWRHPLAEIVFLHEGDTVTKGQIICVLQAGEVLVPVEADRDGVVGRVLADEGSLIGYGASLLAWG